MTLTARKLVTIVTESAIEKNLVKDLKTLGVKGFTIVACEGEGDRGVRRGDWDQVKNIMINCVCSDELALSVMDYVYDHYYEDYAMISYLSEVFVRRNTKF